MVTYQASRFFSDFKGDKEGRRTPCRRPALACGLRELPRAARTLAPAHHRPDRPPDCPSQGALTGRLTVWFGARRACRRSSSRPARRPMLREARNGINILQASRTRSRHLGRAVHWVIGRARVAPQLGRSWSPDGKERPPFRRSSSSRTAAIVLAALA